MQREALAESLAVWDLNDPQRHDGMLETIVAAAHERLSQLPEKCSHGKIEQHWVPVDELPPTVNNAVCPGGVYPFDLVEPVFGLIYEAFGWEDAPECRELAVRILTLTLGGKS